MMKFKKACSFFLCVSLLLGVGVFQCITGIAKEECTCHIQVHGSNCPLSRCECSWKDNHYELNRSVDDHDEGCPLYGMNKDALLCVCEADVHAKGCPRYVEDPGNAQSLEMTLTNTAGTDIAETLDDPNGTDAVISGETDRLEDDAPATKSEDEMIRESSDNTGTEAVENEPADNEKPAESSEEMEVNPSEDSDVPSEEIADSEETESSEGTDTETEETANPDASDEDSEESADGEAINPEEEETEADNEDSSLDPESPEPPTDEVIDPEWEYPTGWAGYGEGKMQGNVLVAEKAFSMPALLNAQVSKVTELLATEHSIKIVDTNENFADILAVYALLSGKTADYPYAVTIDDNLFNSVYWSMTQITGVSNTAESVVHINRLSAAQAAEVYKLNAEQIEILNGLTAKNGVVNEIIDESIFASLTSTEFMQVSGMVSKSLSPERRAVLLAALSLNGKVDYFWGGKSLAYGWDDRWGETRVVSSEGSSSYGTYRPLGLDCSGFVSWSFVNAFGPDYGTFSSTGWNNAPHIEWNEAKPGDIALTDGHVGIVLTADENGPTSYIHCSIGGVSITNNIDTFGWLVRPTVLGD